MSLTSPALRRPPWRSCASSGRLSRRYPGSVHGERAPRPAVQESHWTPLDGI